MFHFGYQLNITRGMVTTKMRFVQLTVNQMMAQNARDDDLQLRNDQGVFMSIGHIQLWEPYNTHATSIFLRQTGILGNILTTGLQLCHRYWFPNDPNMYPFPSANNPLQNSVPCPERQMENYRYSILPQLCPLSKSLFLLHSKLLTNFSWFLCKPHNNSTMTSLTPLHDFFELTEQIEQLSLTLALSSPGFAFLF